jgi:hypothetical protein
VLVIVGGDGGSSLGGTTAAPNPGDDGGVPMLVDSRVPITGRALPYGVVVVMRVCACLLARSFACFFFKKNFSPLFFF